MALPDYGRIATGTTIQFSATGGQAAITLASLASTPAARQSVKYDFGATRARLYHVIAQFEFVSTVTAGAAVSIYLNPSSSATAGTDNLGGCSGADAAYTGISTLAGGILQLIYIGDFVADGTAQGTAQLAHVGYILVPERYNSIVVVNNTAKNFYTTEANLLVQFRPVADEIDDT